MANILLVEDDHDVAFTLSEYLRSKAHKIKCVPDGQEALQIIEDRHPDIIITDIIMPNMNGIAFIRAVKEGYPSLKIIAISGGGRVGANEYLSSAEVFGAEKIFSKPINNDQLIQAIDTLLLQ